MGRIAGGAAGCGNVYCSRGIPRGPAATGLFDHLSRNAPRKYSEKEFVRDLLLPTPSPMRAAAQSRAEPVPRSR